ncbi:MAG TPA: hypothetical protein DIT64_11275 [Verrucomicrobiales bacterium]|mgnify:CR=1 FL=1|nr:hypothetical protein [Verrucomicrobiales bacterium]HCN78041.1 hypothetical protein [Verrucomicrobiales bacterium]HRJ07812.1 hypothetical protein [Prosthecobacter sp.]HRK14184.1 hypothetical protein [Prosthecobacter sp.]
MNDYICHDFKTPRTDTSKRLPDTFKAVPIAFYLAVVGGACFMTLDWLAYKKAEQAKALADSVKAGHEAVIKQLQDEKTALDAETAKAESLAKWVEGTRNVQPVCVAIARAMPPEVRLTDLTLERSDQVPSNLALSIRINGGSAREVGLVDTSVSRLNYRSYSPQQTKEGDLIEYRSTLVRMEN